MAQRGKKAKIDLVELEKLCSLQCTDQEIGAWFNVSTRTVERWRLRKRFADVMERGRGKGRISVRRLQMKLLESGNATMGVWLGKQILGQTDQLEFLNAPIVQVVFPPQINTGDHSKHAVVPGDARSPHRLSAGRQLEIAEEDQITMSELSTSHSRF